MSNPTSAGTIKTLLKPIAAIPLAIGIDVRKLVHVRRVPRYLSQYRTFKALGGSITHRYPVLSDYDSEAGSARGHYFHQDLLVASLINRHNPRRHIDIGSRIDGFVAHVASFRKIEVMDVRKLNETGHQNISFLQADLMDENSVRENVADSISCLHTIEHFGLGRYGDSIDPEGHIKGFRNILRMLETNGTLYISFPIGRQTAIHFNAHRVFHPTDILSWTEGREVIKLLRFDYVDDDGKLHQNVELQNKDLDVVYGCGIYMFQKAA